MGKRPRLALKDRKPVVGFCGWGRKKLHKGEALRAERPSLGVGRNGGRKGEVCVEEGARRGELDGP